jgi:6-phosphogluconolactonase
MSPISPISTRNNSSTSTVYVSHADSGDISVLRLCADTATLESIEVVAVGGTVMPLALSPDRRLLYAARRSEPFAVLTFAITPGDGMLRPLGETALPHSMASIAVDGSGRTLFGASYGGHLLSAGRIDAAGRPQAARHVIEGVPNAHAIHADPGNRFVLATSLGSDRVLQFRFDAATGALTPNEPAAFVARPGAGPRHLVFHPALAVVYLLNELDAGIDVLAFDRERGTLSALQTVSALPPGFSGEPWAAELRLTPDGRFLYASERRSSTLAGFAVDAATGTLAPCGHWPTQAQPRGFAIDPSGQFVIVAGQGSNRVGLHRIDADDGGLTAVGEHAVGAGPNWVEVAEPA